jgi:SulP family sulfate permease
VGVGILLAVVLFVVSYSRISVVTHTLSGATYRSNVDRPRAERQALRQRGQWLTILELQGFLFFGTANKLLEMVRARMDDPDLPAPRFIVLDFRQVLGLDASGVLSFAKIKQLAQARDASLVFTQLTPRMQRQLDAEILTDEEGVRCCVHSDLDHGVEWCEEQILQMSDVEAPPASDFLEATGLARLTELMDQQVVPAGHYLIHQGDPPKGLYLIETGQVTALRECPDGRVIRLRKMGPGTIVGEMGLYLGMEASASVVTEQPSTVYYLSIEHLQRVEQMAPGAAATFYRHSAQLLSERLSFANDTLQALLVEPEADPTAGSSGEEGTGG